MIRSYCDGFVFSLVISSVRRLVSLITKLSISMDMR